jgi:hypothetical protein
MISIGDESVVGQISSLGASTPKLSKKYVALAKKLGKDNCVAVTNSESLATLKAPKPVFVLFDKTGCMTHNTVGVDKIAYAGTHIARDSADVEHDPHFLQCMALSSEASFVRTAGKPFKETRTCADGSTYVKESSSDIFSQTFDCTDTTRVH